MAGSISRPMHPRPSFDNMKDVIRLEMANVHNQRAVRSFSRGLASCDPGPGVSVTAIHRCLYASVAGLVRLRAPEVMMLGITRASRNNIKRRYGWYGTSPMRLEATVFDGRRPADAHLGWGAYSMGLYLAPTRRSGLNASYTMPDADGEYPVLFCRVITRGKELSTLGSN